MSYFSRRNKHIVEFSGHEEVSRPLRERLSAILRQYVGENPISYNGDDPWYVEWSDFRHEVQKEFPGKDPFNLIDSGEFHEIFTVVEIFLDMVIGIYYSRRGKASLEILQAFNLSGSVYTIKNRRVELKIDEDLAKKIENTKLVLADNQSAYDKFFDAIVFNYRELGIESSEQVLGGGRGVDMIYSVDEGEWMGERRVELIVKDISH